MPELSKASLYRLNTCHKDLQKIFLEVAKHRDFTIICGHRPELEQNESFRTGHSKLKFPQSKHNSFPSKAIDVICNPIDWRDRERLLNFIGFVSGIAAYLGIRIRCGADFNGDLNFKNDSFFDGFHVELVD